MGQARQPQATPPRPPAVWPRPRHRRWTRPDRVPSPATLLALIPSLPRAALAQLTARMIDRMDELDGDPDVESNGDELDGAAAEDDFYPHKSRPAQPGCPVSDPGEEDDPAGGAVDDAGEADDHRNSFATMPLPRYGDDQTLGPTNYAAAHQQFDRDCAAYDRHTPPIGVAVTITRPEEQCHG